MRKFNVTVNGKSYEVEVEETGAPAAMAAISVMPVISAISAAQAPAAAPAVSQPPPVKPVPAPKPVSGAAGSLRIIAPMPGTIIKVLVEPGQAVKKGTILLILEAMKMENEIMSGQDGTIASVNVTKNQQVNTGDLMVSMN